MLAIHSTTDSCHGLDDFGRLIGARFECHPFTQEPTIDAVDAGHPATRDLPVPWLLEDETYLFRSLRPDARILLRPRQDGLDKSRPGAHVPDVGFPLATRMERVAGLGPRVLHLARPLSRGLGEHRSPAPPLQRPQLAARPGEAAD